MNWYLDYILGRYFDQCVILYRGDVSVELTEMVKVVTEMVKVVEVIEMVKVVEVLEVMSISICKSTACTDATEPAIIIVANATTTNAKDACFFVTVIIIQNRHYIYIILHLLNQNTL